MFASGGKYRLVFMIGNDASKQVAFFGRYIEVTPSSRLVWTSDEGDEEGAVTTATFEEKDGKTLLGRARPLSLEGSSGRCHHLREHGGDARAARATR